MQPPGYESKLNQQIIITGIAENAKLGAVVSLEDDDDTIVYIDGLREWDESMLHQTIVVAGILRSRKLAPDPVMAEGHISHGIFGESLVLENPTWTVNE